MNTRKIFMVVLIGLLLSSSVVWGARLMKSQSASNSSSSVPQPPVPPLKSTSAQNQVTDQNILPSSSSPATQYQTPVPPAPGRIIPPQQNMTEQSSSGKSSSSPSMQDRVEGKKGGKQYVTMDFDGVDIKVFVKFIADITGKNFILDDKVTGKVTVISPRKMTLEEAYQVFLSVLDVNGFGTVNMGSVIKVVQVADAVTRSLGTSTTPPKRREDVLITQIIPLKHADVNDMKSLFQPLLTKGSAQLLAYPQSNILIITDTKSNIKKMMEILNHIDAKGFSEEFRIFPLTHASAADLSAKLQEIITDTGGTPVQVRVRSTAAARQGQMSERGKARIIPYERTNSLIILATASDMNNIDSLIRKLDIPTPSGTEDIHVYYLQYARSEDIAKVLTDIPTPAKNEGVPGAQAAAATGQTGMRSSTGSDKVKISSDKETNSLIIYAGPDAYKSIMDTIKYLDIPRKQVYVKALIMEVNQNKDFSVGVEWTYFEDFTYHSGDDKRTGGVFGRTGNNFITSLSDVPSGAAFGIVGDAITIGSGDTKITFPNMTSFISAMAQDTDVNILSTPQIITMDNKEAEIKVGANVPYLSREQTDTTNITNTVRTFDYKDVGVTLRLTPLINQQGNIRLELFQENTSLVEGAGEQEYAPTTLKRSAKTTVTIKDGATMVIGGLIGDNVTLGESGVPLLRSIPLIGYLFKTKSSNREKTNMYIFITPKVIDTEEKASDLYREKYGNIMDLKVGKPVDKKKDKKKDKADEDSKP